MADSPFVRLAPAPCRACARDGSNIVPSRGRAVGPHRRGFLGVALPGGDRHRQGGAGAPVDELQERPVGETRLLGEADLAGARRRVALRAARGQRRLEVPERVLVQLGRVKPFSPANPQHCTASTVTTWSLQARDHIDERVGEAHLAHAADRMHGHRAGSAVDHDRGQHLIPHERRCCPAPRAGRRGSAASGRRRGWCRTRWAGGHLRSRPAAPPRARRTSRRRLHQSLGLERLSAAEPVHPGRVDDVEAGLAEEARGRDRQRLGLVVAALRAHVARGAAREIDDGVARRSTGAPRHGKRTGRGNAGDHFGSVPPESLRSAVERALHRAAADHRVHRVGTPSPPRTPAERARVVRARRDRRRAAPSARRGGRAGS